MCSNDRVKSVVSESLYPRNMGEVRDFGLFVEADAEIQPKEKSSDLVTSHRGQLIRNPLPNAAPAGAYELPGCGSRASRD